MHLVQVIRSAGLHTRHPSEQGTQPAGVGAKPWRHRSQVTVAAVAEVACWLAQLVTALVTFAARTQVLPMRTYP